MQSVADRLRIESREAEASDSPAARLERALMLGDCDVEAFAIARELSSDEARRILGRARAVGRRASVANALDRP